MYGFLENPANNGVRHGHRNWPDQEYRTNIAEDYRQKTGSLWKETSIRFESVVYALRLSGVLSRLLLEYGETDETSANLYFCSVLV